MPAFLAPGLLSLVASAGLAITSQVGARVEARAREFRPPVGENVATRELEVEPGVALEGSSPTFELLLAYAPRFTWVSGDVAESELWLHRAWAGLLWLPVPSWQVEAGATATIGTMDLFRMATAPGQPGEPPPVGQAAPVATLLDYRRYEVVLAADGHLAHRLDLNGRAVLLQEGGADAADRLILPLQRSAHLRGELTWRASGRTTLAGILSASETRYDDVAVAGAPADARLQSWSVRLARAEAIWRYFWTNHTRTWAGAGVTWIDSHAPGAGAPDLQPIGEVGIATESGAGWPRLSGGLLAASAPLEDRLTGTVSQRAEARAWGSWSPTEHWVVGGSAMAARVMEGPTAEEAFTAGELYVSRTYRDQVAVTAGGRWTSAWPAPVAGRSVLPESQWMAYVAVQGVYRSGDGRGPAGPVGTIGIRPLQVRRTRLPAAAGPASPE